MNLNFLNKKINESGIAKVNIAKALGETSQSLWLKLRGENNFSLKNAAVLTDILHLSDEEAAQIFLKEEEYA